MQTWFGFFALAGGASATLMGLLFVSVSLNTASVFGTKFSHARRMAEQAFQNYMAVLIVSLLALFPTLEIRLLGMISIALTAVQGVWVLVRLYHTVTKTPDPKIRRKAMRRQYSSVLGFGMLLYAAGSMALGDDDSRNTFAAAAMVLLGSATVSSWELLVGVGRAGAQPDVDADIG
jgi:hypothetical protein